MPAETMPLSTQNRELDLSVTPVGDGTGLEPLAMIPHFKTLELDVEPAVLLRNAQREVVPFHSG